MALVFKKSFASHVSCVVLELNLFLQGSEEWALRSFGMPYFISGVVLKTLEKNNRMELNYLWCKTFKSARKFTQSRGAFLWDDLDQDQWFEITLIMVDQMNWWIHSGSLFWSTMIQLSDLRSLILIWIIPKEHNKKGSSRVPAPRMSAELNDKFLSHGWQISAEDMNSEVQKPTDVCVFRRRHSP